MRKLYLRNHATDLHGTTIIRDYQGRSCYLLVGKWGMRYDVLSLYAISGALLAEVKQQSLGLLPKFSLYVNRQKVGTVAKSLGFVRQFIFIRGLNWIIVGSPLAGRYRVFQGGHRVFSIQPVEKTATYYHELTVDYQADEPLAILVASVLDHWARRGQRRPSRLRFHNPQTCSSLGMGISLRHHHSNVLY